MDRQNTDGDELLTAKRPTVPPDTDAELRTIAMPADTNAFGDIFGGWLLAQMDLAAGSFAMQQVGGRVATVGIEAMSFHRPVMVGDQVSCYCAVVRVGRTSITVKVETWARRQSVSGEVMSEKVTEGTFSFVALGSDGRKREIGSLGFVDAR